LSTVGEVTELGFPQDESVRVGLGIAILEAEDSILRKVRVGSDKVSCAVSTRDARVDRHIAAIFVLVEHVSVSVREGSTLNILTGETHVVALVDKSSEGKSLSSSPINALSTGNSGLTSLENLDNLRVEFLILGQVSNFLTNSLKVSQRNTSVLQRSILGFVLNGLPFVSHPVLLVERVALGLLVGFLKRVDAFLVNSSKSFLRHALVEKLLAVLVSGRHHTLDDLVHKRLGEHGLIKLVVTHLSVGDQVNHDIAVESLSVLSSDLESLHDIL